MTATALGSLSGESVLVMEDCTVDPNFLTGLVVEGDSQVFLEHCGLASQAQAFVSRPYTDEDENVHYPRVRARHCTATSAAPAWDVEGQGDRLLGCGGTGMRLSGVDGVAHNFDATGVFDTAAAMELGGTRCSYLGGSIAGVGTNGVWSNDARCGRVFGVSIYASRTNTTNLSGYAVVVTGTNEVPEVLLDRIDVVCGPGQVSSRTYGCNVDFPPFTPCDSCPDCNCAHSIPGPCEDPCVDTPPSYARDPDNCHPCSDDPFAAMCLNEACWPEEDGPDWLPQLVGECWSTAAMFSILVPVKTTRAVPLVFRELVAGAISNIYTAGTYDCLAYVELNVWSDNYPDLLGDTEVIIHDDESGEFWTVTCPAADASATMLLSHDLFPLRVGATPSQLRAELVSVTDGLDPDTIVEASVTLHLL